MLAPIARLTNQVGRNVMNNIVRNSHSNGGIPGENLPFSLTNRYKLTLYFILYFGSGLSAPYLITRHQLLKKPDGLTLVPWKNGKCLVWDATCAYTAASHLGRTVQSPSSAAKDAGLKKRLKYSAMDPLYHFVPIAVKTE